MCFICLSRYCSILLSVLAQKGKCSFTPLLSVAAAPPGRHSCPNECFLYYLEQQRASWRISTSFFEANFNIFLTYTTSCKWSHSLRLSRQASCTFSHASQLLRPPQPCRCEISNSISQAVWILKLLIMQFSVASCYLLLLMSRHSPEYLVLKQPPSLNVRDQVYTHKKIR